MKSTPAPAEAAARAALSSASASASSSGGVAAALTALHGLRHLNAHDDTDAGCVCARCVTASGGGFEDGGVAYVLDVVVSDGRAFFYWVPPALADDRDALADRMRRRLARHLKTPRENPQRGLRFSRHELDRRARGKR